MLDKKNRIAMFLDFEDISMALKGEDPNFPRPADIIRPIIEEFYSESDVVVRYAYGDWTRFPRDTVQIVESLGFTPVYSLTKSKYNKNTSEMNIRNAVPIRLALDALYLCLHNSSIDKVVFVTGDREYFEVIDKLRENDTDVTLVAFERSISSETADIVGVETVLLENLVGPAKSSGPEPEKKIDWAPFIRLLLSLELRYGYVGYRGLKEKLDRSVGCGNSEQDKRRFMDLATQQEIITLDKMENPKNPEFPLTVCRLNRKHPIVQNILKNSLRIE